MSIFTEPGLKLNFLEASGRRAILLEEIRYEIEKKGSGVWLVIPEGFDTDGATVPRLFWWFLPPWGTKTSKAAIVHDYLIHLLRHERHLLPPGVTKRAQADLEMLRAMLAINDQRHVRAIVYVCISLMTLLTGE